MSSVRMCDNPNCGEIFSEAEVGWTVSTQAKIVEDDNGQRRTVNMNVDLCPDCSPDTRTTAKELGRRRRENRVHRLELETGVGGSADIERELKAEEAKRDAD